MRAAEVISLLNVLVPVVTPVLGAAVVALRERRARRGDAGRRKLVLDDAQAQVAFVTEWWKARRAVDLAASGNSAPSQEAERLARGWLDRASTLVEDNQLSLPPVEPAITFRRLVLLDGFRTTAGKLVRSVFWIFCGLTVTTVGATISQQIGPERARTGWVAAFVIAGAVIIPVTVTLRFVAVAVDHVAGRPDGTGRQKQGFVRELLLLRHLRGRGASTIRVLFYLSAVAVIGYLAHYINIAFLRPDLYWWLPLTVAGAVVYGTATFGIRAWAVSIDKRAWRPNLPVQENAQDQIKERASLP